MTVILDDLYCVVYTDYLTNEVVVYRKLFSSKEEAQTLAGEVGGSAYPVHYSSKK
jgi:hypothetical protein